MTRSLGISLQPDGFHYAFLDGSAKKYSVKACGSGRFDPEAKDPERAMGRSIARALKEGGVGKVDEVVATVPTLDTVLRELSLPFSDRDKVHQVLKYEVESDLYHLDIDDVVCDFLELEDERATSTVLVSAVPKAEIGQALDMVEESGNEPFTIDTDLGALLCALKAEQRDDADVGRLEAFLYLGPYSSLLLVMEGQNLRAVRAIKVGWRELGRGLEDQAIAFAEAEDAEEEGVTDIEVNPEDSELDESEEEPVPGVPRRPFGADPALPVGLDLDDVLARASSEARASMTRRLASEVRRGLAAVASAPVGRLNLLGANVPGLDEALQARLGVPAAPLELRIGDSGKLEPDPVAAGAALRGLGSTASRMNFRQEEYRVTRGLERVEGPLTWMLVGLIAFLLVDSVVLYQKGSVKQKDCEAIFQSASKKVERDLNEVLRDGDPDDWRVRTSFEGTTVDELDRIRSLRSRVERQKRELDTLVGEAGVDMPEDCLEAWRLVTWALERELKDYNKFGNRWMLESLDFTSNDERQKVEAHVACKIGLTIFGSDALAIDRKFEDVQRTLRSQPWSVGDAKADGGFTMADTPGARTGVITVNVSPAKAREAGL